MLSILTRTHPVFNRSLTFFAGTRDSKDNVRWFEHKRARAFVQCDGSGNQLRGNVLFVVSFAINYALQYGLCCFTPWVQFQRSLSKCLRRDEIDKRGVSRRQPEPCVIREDRGKLSAMFGNFGLSIDQFLLGQNRRFEMADGVVPCPRVKPRYSPFGSGDRRSRNGSSLNRRSSSATPKDFACELARFEAGSSVSGP